MSSQNKTGFKFQLLSISLLFYTAILSSTANAFPEEEMMVTEPQAKENIQNHKNRVTEVGLYILETQAAQFPALSRLPESMRSNIVKTYLSLHDNPKTWEREKLEMYGYKLEYTIFEYIMLYWGQALPPDQKQWVYELNRIEDFYKQHELFDLLKQVRVHLHERIFSELRMLEKVSDIYDTKTHRVVELNIASRKAAPFATQQFFLEVEKSAVLANIARNLEIAWSSYSRSCQRVLRKR